MSFGGLVATEMSKQLHPEYTVLISSAVTRAELPMLYRFFGRLGIVPLLPCFLFRPPTILANWAFETKHKKLLDNILNDTNLGFAKWAVNALLTWSNSQIPTNPVLQISGTKDRLIPPKNKHHTALKLIEKGAHFMIVDRAAEVSQMVNDFLFAHSKP